MYVCMYVCMFVCMHVCMYVCMYICTYIRTYVCVYLCMYVNKKKVCSYISLYPIRRTTQSALHFTPWQTCSFLGHLNLSGNVCMYLRGYVHVFLLDGLHVGRQTGINLPPHERNVTPLFCSKYPVCQGFLVVFMVNQMFAT